MKPMKAKSADPVDSKFKVVRRHIQGLRRALAGLSELGLYIDSVDMRNGDDKPLLEMAPTPYLHRICVPVNTGQKQIGNTLFSRFTGEFGGVTLAWWESAWAGAA